jgi:hypothetical protein
MKRSELDRPHLNPSEDRAPSTTESIPDFQLRGGGHGKHTRASCRSPGRVISAATPRAIEIILGIMRSAPVIHGSADPAFRGDRSRWNPEELLVASLSAVVSPPRRRSWDHRDRLCRSCRGGAGGRAPVQKRGAAPDRDRGGGQRRKPGANSPPTRSREVLHRQIREFPCRVRAGDCLGRLSGGHRGDKSRRSGRRSGAGYGEEIPDAAPPTRLANGR